MAWLRLDHGMVATWSWHGRDLIMAWLRLDHGMVAAWSWHGRGLIMVWSRLNIGMVANAYFLYELIEREIWTA